MTVSTPAAAEYHSIASARRSPSNNSPVVSVTWLLRWCPEQARAFALAMHELAAWQYDDSRTEYWRGVLDLLPGN